uniref:Uncharacterized protein n=1 Tax=Neobodo designis TaxID=312471 RepID=A0A6U4U3V9_NEODS
MAAATVIASQPVRVNELRFKSGEVRMRRLEGRVADLVPLRRREYLPGLVLNFTIVDAAGDRMRVFLYDDWGSGLSIVNEGETVTIAGSFTLTHAPEQSPDAPGLAKDTATTIGAPQTEVLLLANSDTVVTVEQGADHGDTMVLEVTAKTFDNPVVRVKRKPTDSVVLSHQSV